MSRWAECPGSIRLSEGIESRGSKYAEEGTKAHGIAAKILMSQDVESDVPEEMMDAVKVYVDYVLTKWAGAAKNMASWIKVEERFDLGKLYPGLFGTTDCAIWNENTKTLTVIDYKHGAGVSVSPEGNKQLQYYALGALYNTDAKPQHVEIVVVQPRCYGKAPVSEWKTTPETLLDFAADLIEAAKRTEEPDAPLNPGDHCRFCPAAPICPELSKRALETARMDFEAVGADQISQALSFLPVLKRWIESVEEYAYTRLTSGKEVPGFKLVAKRAHRKWIDDTLTAEWATKNKLSGVYETKLKSPAQIEKLIPKSLKKDLDGLVSTASPGMTLVPADDPREAIHIVEASKDFEKVSHDE
jgi:hypothetical protein